MSNAVEFKHISVHEGPEKSPGFLLWHISTSWRSSIEAVLKPLALTHPQFVVLATLGWLTKDGVRVTQAAIGKMAGLDPNTTSQIMRGLEIKKLIKRVPSSDPRAKNPLLTTQGAKSLSLALPAVESADAQFFDALTMQETGVMIQIFQKLSKKML
jgi:DNA-binding MarR family transcriptional regulator